MDFQKIAWGKQAYFESSIVLSMLLVPSFRDGIGAIWWSGSPSPDLLARLIENPPLSLEPAWLHHPPVIRYMLCTTRDGLLEL